jgi:hypothetical protein
MPEAITSAVSTTFIEASSPPLEGAKSAEDGTLKQSMPAEPTACSTPGIGNGVLRDPQFVFAEPLFHNR